MRGSVLTILFIILMMIGLQAIAQGNGSGVISIDLNATQTADAQSTIVRSSVTVHPFEVRATEIIVEASQTAQAQGITGEQAQINAQPVDATATDIASVITSVPDNLVDEETQTDTSSMNLTLLSLGLGVVVLVIMGGAYAMIASRIEQK